MGSLGMFQTLLGLFFIVRSVYTNTPIVFWHGMGDSCCNTYTSLYLNKTIRAVIPDVYIRALQIGNNPIDDVLNTFLSDTNLKVKVACEMIKNDPKLANGYYGLGFSQGGQFLRAVAQRCPNPPMLKLISVGGQHQGVFGIPYCTTGIFCSVLGNMASFFAYFGIIQRNFVQASYWHDPFSEDVYRNYNKFLADINQEKRVNLDYRNNLMKLKAFVLVRFTQDQMVIPQESQWFGFFKKNSYTELYHLEESHLYLNDTLGLRTLAEQGKLHKLSVKGRHLEMSRKWFINNVIIPFLKDDTPVKNDIKSN